MKNTEQPSPAPAGRLNATISRKLRWGVLSTANIGLKKVIPAMQQGQYASVAAIASRDLSKAQAAAAALGIPAAYGSYEELLAVLRSGGRRRGVLRRNRKRRGCRERPQQPAALERSRDAIAATLAYWPCCIAGITFFRPMLAVLSTPQRSFLEIVALSLPAGAGDGCSVFFMK